MSSNVKFNDNSVCFADGEQWFSNKNESLSTDCGDSMEVDSALDFKDFQLNTIKQGDYIEASEVNVKQKYSDAVDVFGLFGFECKASFESVEYKGYMIADGVGGLHSCRSNQIEASSRKITFIQLIVIGALKRLELERDKKSAPNKIAPDLTPDLVQSPSHYQLFEGVEVIEIIASSMTLEQFKGYCLGNRIKYRLRAGNKDKLEQEIAKSDKYVELYDEHKHLCKNDGDLK